MECVCVQTIEVLARLYGSVEEVDLFAGAVGERAVEGAILGPTFLCLVGDQFARLKRADRFFYEEGNQPSAFSSRNQPYITTPLTIQPIAPQPITP